MSDKISKYSEPLQQQDAHNSLLNEAMEFISHNKLTTASAVGLLAMATLPGKAAGLAAAELTSALGKEAAVTTLEGIAEKGSLGGVTEAENAFWRGDLRFGSGEMTKDLSASHDVSSLMAGHGQLSPTNAEIANQLTEKTAAADSTNAFFVSKDFHFGHSEFPFPNLGANLDLTSQMEGHGQIFRDITLPAGSAGTVASETAESNAFWRGGELVFGDGKPPILDSAAFLKSGPESQATFGRTHAFDEKIGTTIRSGSQFVSDQALSPREERQLLMSRFKL